MMVAAAVVSLGFVLFILVIGFVLFFKTMGEALFNVFMRGMESLVHAVAPQWQPGEAWFARRHARAEKREETDELKKEVEARREEEKE